MANFKIHYGTREELERTPLTVGYAYFTPEDGRFYIDGKHNDEIKRYCLNPEYDFKTLFKHYASVYEFPNIGEENYIYVDDSTGDTFLFGVIENTYTSIGIATNDTIYGGDSVSGI